MGILWLPITSECSLNVFYVAHVYMHVRAIANSTRKRTQTQINACKRIAAIDVWAISARKRDCILRVESKTFGMYYTYVYYKT